MRLSELWLVVKARKWRFFSILGAVLAAAVIVTVLIPQAFLATASVVIDHKATDPLTGSTSPGELLPINLATQIEIINSPRVASKVVEQLKLDRSPTIIEKYREETGGEGSLHDWIVGRILQKLTVEPSHQSNVIDISFSSNDPKFSAAVANAFANAYMETDFELGMDPAGRQTTWFAAQLSTLKQDLQSAQQRLVSFQQKHNAVGNDDKLDVEDGKLVELTNQLVIAQSGLSDIQTRQRQMNQALKKGQAAELPDVLGNSLLQSMKADMVRAEGKFSEISQKYDKNHPQYRSAVAELQTLRSKFDAEVQTATGAITQSAEIAAQRLADVQRMVDAQKKRILDLKQQRDSTTVLQREVDVAQRAYDALSARATEIRLQSELNQSSVAVLDTASVPTHFYRPKPVLNLALALVLGGLLATAFCSSAELKDPRLRAATDRTDVLGVPLIADIPAKPRRRLFRKARTPVGLLVHSGGR